MAKYLVSRIAVKSVTLNLLKIEVIIFVLYTVVTSNVDTEILWSKNNLKLIGRSLSLQEYPGVYLLSKLSHAIRCCGLQMDREHTGGRCLLCCRAHRAQLCHLEMEKNNQYE